MEELRFGKNGLGNVDWRFKRSEYAILLGTMLAGIEMEIGMIAL